MNTKQLEEFLFRVRNPQAYTGLEINAERKVPVEGGVSVCLVFPDTYEIGMSHQGLKILYHRLNAMEGVFADRCFLPEPESADLYGELGLPLFSIEQHRPLKDFDLIGFSLLTEFSFTGVLHTLDLAGLSLLSSERKDNDPLVVAGGISVVNPEPLREFVDAFALGDGEVLFPPLIDAVKKDREVEGRRPRLMDLLDRIPGIYVPSRYPTRKRGRFMVPEMDGKGISCSVMEDIDDSLPHEKLIVPLGRTVFDRMDVEIARGCPQACRFCQARSYYAPYRTKSPERSLSFLRNALKETGFESFSLSSLSAGDYPWLSDLLKEIPNVLPEGTSMSVPSLRPGTLTRDLLRTISTYRRTGITIVPEAGTERLRDVINKRVTDAEIFTAVDNVVDLGWRKIKLYFMIGLPTETEKDMDGIVHLIEEIVRKRARLRIHASFSAFVPKPHTPLQWARRESHEVLMQRIRGLKQRLRHHRNLDLDFSSTSLGVVETILSRGDDRVGELLSRVYRQGERYTAWKGHFDFSVWERHIQELGLECFLDDIPLDQPLPWDHMLVDRKREHLEAEYRSALEARPSPSCGERDCGACRGCYAPQPRSPEIRPFDASTETPPIDQEPEYRPVRLRFRKDGDYRFFSHLALMHYMERLIRRSGFRFRLTEGFHQRMKMITLPPLPVLARGLEEVVEIHMDAGCEGPDILEQLKRGSGHFPWLRVTALLPGSRNLQKSIEEMVYRVAHPSPGEAIAVVEPMLEANDGVEKVSGGLRIRIGRGGDGAGRFARLQKQLDPLRERIHLMTRERVILSGPGEEGIER